MALTSIDIDYYAPGFEIKINNSALPDEAAYAIESVEVTQRLNRPNDFHFSVQDEFRGGRFRWLGHKLFEVGNDVSISMGYTGRLVELARGKLQNIGASFTLGTAPTFRVEAADSVHRFMTVQGGERVFRDKTDSEIVRAIAAEGNMTAQVDDTGRQPIPNRVKSAGKSYSEYLRGLASDNGFEFRFSGTTLYFRIAGARKEPVAHLKWGESLTGFRPTMSTAHAVSSVVVKGWDRKRKQPIEARVDAGQEGNKQSGQRLCSQVTRDVHGDVVKEITDRPVRSEEEARNIAKSELGKSSGQFISGSAETIGVPELQPGVCVELHALGDWFSGRYHVEEVRHTMGSSGYQTSLELRRNAV